jgi:N-dimethylarginine dimethylaminohydrolase
MAIWTEWDPLEEIIVGTCPPENFYDNVIQDERSLPLLQTILRETREDLDTLAASLEKMGVKVYRPKNLPFERGIDIAGFKVKNPVAPIVPRDQYLVYGEKIVQTYTSMPDRWLESLAYYDIFRELFEQGFEWNSMPPPLLENFPDNSIWYSDSVGRYHNVMKDRLLWHTATMFKCGDALITNTRGPGNDLGLEWMRRQYPEARILHNKATVQDDLGHIDHGFFMTDDETVFAEKEFWAPAWLTKNKEVIYLHDVVDTPDFANYDHAFTQSQGKFSYDYLNIWMSEWKGYVQEVAFDFNVLVVDSKNIFISNEQPKLQEMLDKRGITCHVSPIRHNHFWDGGIHCLTLDVKRRGERRKVVNVD